MGKLEILKINALQHAVIVHAALLTCKFVFILASFRLDSLHYVGQSTARHHTAGTLGASVKNIIMKLTKSQIKEMAQ
ncbi:hypothetical protein ACE1ET_20485, partial [Saccharicrinis sp. FJH62]|uniref:hypothetical protein n=1 Tax=Saccharicrinis sp. FJH62 TaxID=3344657 RepID=UPI0035D4FFDD